MLRCNSAVSPDVRSQAIASAQLPTTDPLYWARIAAVVGRTADECFNKFHSAYPTPGAYFVARSNSGTLIAPAAKKDKKQEKEISLDHNPGTSTHLLHLSLPVADRRRRCSAP